MKKTIGVIAHVDAGKTTFSEGLLYHTDTIRELGRVDHQNSYLDTHQIEKERGITIFSEQAVMKYKGDTYYLIDTPGHVDFSPEMERTIMVMDYAIIIVSAVEGVQGHTETVWELLKKHKIPSFFFINKTDRVGADVDRVIEEIRANLTENICLLSNSLTQELDEEIIEFMAERNDKLLELYLGANYSKEIWIAQMKKMIKENQLYLSASGSALHDQGIIQFFDNFHQLTETNYNDQSLKARIYKIGYDDQRNRISFMKILGGSIEVRDQLSYLDGEEKISEKISQLRVYNGENYQTVDSAEAGQLVGVMGLSKTKAGMGIGKVDSALAYNMIPTLRSKVIFDSSTNLKEVLTAFNILNDEDPSLQLSWEKELQEIQIKVMGPIQLEILKEVVKDRFDLEVEFGEPGIIYKETINDQVFGYGHFEPLKHYAEVHLKIESGVRDSGIIFENLAHVDDLSQGHQNLVEQHIFEKEHRGLLTGSPLTDLKISLVTGRGHNKHTSGGDFREATYRALRQGLEKADKILLEPYYGFKIKVGLDDMGRVLADIQKASGSFEPPETIEDKVIIKGKAPVATFMNYPTELLAFTSGKGMINLVFSGYDICHNQEEVIERINYDKDADVEYSSSSVFCAKGQGYVVPWYEAEEKMHCG
ncbi:elongation factor G [Orenia marismortui]|uniref:elongation factor G n=1 Tax=Orenia marismortui TaxID=46469 RepID=UPI0003729798|nr:TetM/TetW/TetO/TetS family tetracycline resistance ribosomal protection protein [Orenia marismortui]